MSVLPSATTPDPWGERLPRRLDLASTIAVVIGCTIGSGIFRTPAEIAGHVPDPLWFGVAWLLGGLVALAGALSYAELASSVPRTGGIYVYLRHAFGRPVAFLFGWAELVVLRPAAYGAIAITCADYSFRLLRADPRAAVLGLEAVQIAAAGLVLLVGGVNVRAVRAGAWLQSASTLLKVAAIAVLVVVGFLAPGPGAGPHAVEPTAASPAGSAFWLAMVAVLWAYDGWADVGFVAGEVRDPARALPLAFASGTLLVVVCYLAVNAAYVHALGMAAMPGSPLIAADVAEVVLGAGGVVFVSAAIVVSTFGALNGSVLTGPRVFFAMAEDGAFFRGLAQVHPRWGTPARAIGLSMALGVIFVCVRTFGELADQFVVGIWPFYALGVLALFVLRRREPARPRPFRVPGYPWVPGAFLVVSCALLANYLVARPGAFLASAALIAAGVPVYGLWSRGAAEAARAATTSRTS